MLYLSHSLEHNLSNFQYKIKTLFFNVSIFELNNIKAFHLGIHYDLRSITTARRENLFNTAEQSSFIFFVVVVCMIACVAKRWTLIDREMDKKLNDK